ncbi:MAG: hypothetical protein KIH67_003240 [Candidatus Moranbacteria bacterium]|nr:hypothetical protein [Candidatus Moranbacteria bacterium]
MKKIIIIVILLLLGAGAWYGFILSKKNQPVAPVEEPVEVVSQSVTYSAATNSDTYKEVTYPDPMTKAISEPDELGNVLLAEDKMFMIEYFSNDEVFNITLLGGDLLQARVAAQGRLLEILGITKEDACKIKTNVGAPFSTNEELAGKNLGFSFCENNIDLSPYSQPK